MTKREKSVFTTFEAAKLCHVSPLSIINWVNAGRLPAFRTPGGHRRIRREDLLKFMRDGGIPLPEGIGDEEGRRRILVVDDEGLVRNILSDYLSTRPDANYEVLTAADGFEAGRLVASSRPELVLLDLRMPGLDGFQVCRTIKADPDTANTIVIAMTGYFSSETEAKILECGAIRCFSKPIDPNALSDYINGLFNRPSGPKHRRRISPA